MRVILDIEANNLLNNDSIDYTRTPYRLKDSFKIWCICVIDIDTNEEYLFVGDTEIVTKFIPLSKKFKTIIGHNIIDYDMLALSLYCDLKFSIEDYPLEEYPDTFDGRRAEIVDTLVLSRTLSPDRFGGHSLEKWGERLGCKKTDWRSEAIELGLIDKHAERGAEFSRWHERMGEYCLQDCRVNSQLYFTLIKETWNWDWKEAISLEKSTAHIVTIGSHRGFHFNKDLAIKCVKELDELLEERRNKVEPALPMKPMGKTKQKEFIPPKKQFLKNGEIRQQVISWVEDRGGTIWQENGQWKANIFEKTYDLPLPDGPLVKFEKTKITDSVFIKGWLIEQGWSPVNWKERDLTVDQRKQKITREKYEEVVDRYVSNTIGSAFERDRCEHLQCTPETIKETLLRHDLTKPKKVLTSPTYTSGAEREVCPSLEGLQDRFPYAKDIIEYLTYSHRRNSILGGGVSVEDFEDEDSEDVHKGYLAYLRDDDRIPTPANSCGAASRRFLHKITVNIPRTTSIYGENMRELFGVGKGFAQLGYDFASLEAVITACLVYNYKGGREYGEILMAKKPNDIHSVFARKVSDLIGKDFPRNTAKSAVYGMTYSATAPRVAKIVGCDLSLGKIIYDAYWDFATPLKMAQEDLLKYWSTTGNKKFILGIDGSKIPVRAKNNLINTWCQSSGVICAKRAAVLLQQKMKKEGLYVNPFDNNLETKLGAESIILYHDEQQLEVSKALVKFKMFQDEESAKKYKKEHELETDQILSEVNHINGRYFTAYCRVGELAIEAVKESGKYYKLPIQLSAEYSIGNSWRSCH